MFKFMSEDKLGRILAALVFSKSVTTYTQLLLIISLGYLTTYNTPLRTALKLKCSNITRSLSILSSWWRSVAMLSSQHLLKTKTSGNSHISLFSLSPNLYRSVRRALTTTWSPRRINRWRRCWYPDWERSSRTLSSLERRAWLAVINVIWQAARLGSSTP